MTNFERVNPEFMRVKVNVCYEGENRNWSKIDEPVLMDLAQTIYGVPVIGEIDEENKTFKGHGGKLEISDDGFKVIQTTIPYGFVDPTTPFFFEDILEKDGMTVNKYLSCYAYLWRGRYPILDEVFEKHVGQSMEIAIEDGDWLDNGMFDIKKARFQALCLLGVEPCFESAKATIGYSANEANDLYTEMINKFKQYTVEELGGETMPEVLENNEVVENEVPAVTPEAEVTEEFEENNVEPEVADEPEVVEAVETIEAVEDAEGEEVAEFETEEVEAQEEETAEVEEEVEEATEEVEATENTEVVEAVDAEPEVDHEARIEELEMALANATRELEAMREENARLADFEAEVLAERRNEAEEALFAQFTALEGYEGYAELREKARDFSLEDLELKLFALLGKKNFSMSNKPKKQGAAKLAVGATPTEAKSYYGGRFDKYFK